MQKNPTAYCLMYSLKQKSYMQKKSYSLLPNAYSLLPKAKKAISFMLYAKNPTAYCLMHTAKSRKAICKKQKKPIAYSLRPKAYCLYTFPSFITNFTFSIVLIFLVGSSSTAIISAKNPGANCPELVSIFRILAGTIVAL